MQHAKASEGAYQHDTACTLKCQHQAPCSSVAGRTPAKNPQRYRSRILLARSIPFTQIQARRNKSITTITLVVSEQKVKLCTVEMVWGEKGEEKRKEKEKHFTLTNIKC